MNGQERPRRRGRPGSGRPTSGAARPRPDRARVRSAPTGPDSGIATVWAAVGLAVLMAALMIGLHLGSAVVARHRAESAADLAALAAAVLAVQGPDVACARAAEIAAATGGGLVHCTLDGWEVQVEVRFAVSMPLAGADSAHARARAGPVERPGASAEPDATGGGGDPRGPGVPAIDTSI